MKPQAVETKASSEVQPQTNAGTDCPGGEKGGAALKSATEVLASSKIYSSIARIVLLEISPTSYSYGNGSSSNDSSLDHLPSPLAPPAGDCRHTASPAAARPPPAPPAAGGEQS